MKKYIKKYFIQVWRIVIITVTVSLFTASLYSMPGKTSSVRIGRSLVPQSLITSNSNAEVTQIIRSQQLTYK